MRNISNPPNFESQLKTKVMMKHTYMYMSIYIVSEIVYGTFLAALYERHPGGHLLRVS